MVNSMSQGQLNAGHLGGRFLKRAFPQESNPVPFSVIDRGALTEQPKQPLPDANRRVRTSAAMIGLAAISMGAYSLLAPQQGDSAVAAEPVATEPALPTASNSSDVAVISTARSRETIEVALGSANCCILAAASLINNFLMFLLFSNDSIIHSASP